MFVSEAFLVASAVENKAVVIEKTPDTLDMYDPHQDYIVCANHFQSKGLSRSKENVQQLNESASPYRYNRLMELLNANGRNTVPKTIAILRDQKGLHNTDIGMGNEKAINQLMSHHSIVFEPKKLIVWVSTSPWQLGEYVAYDLKKVFGLRGMKIDKEIYEQNLTIPADTFLSTNAYKSFIAFRKFKQRLYNSQKIDPDSLVATNPQYYHAYVLAGDYLFKQAQFKKALHFYQVALTKVIATKPEENHIKAQIKKCNNKMAS